jgi:vanillate O-demethylase ferredoxin subunit
MAGTSDEEGLRARIVARTMESSDIVSVELWPLEGATLPPFAAGAHVDVHVAPGLVRQYSISNDPREAHRYRLAVLAEPNSRGGSAGIHAGFAVGHVVTLGPPRNLFALEEAADRSILLAGGIGITPLLSMAYRLAALGRKFELHYCVRSAARVAFREELTAGPLAPGVSIHCDDGPDDQRFLLGRTLAPTGGDDHVYVCGPPGFIDFVTEGAKRFGWPGDRVHVERFGATVDTSGEAFTVVTSAGITVEVPGDRSIASVLAEHGVEVPLLCEQGVCGTCLTPVLEGVPDHRDHVQTDAEKASNTQIALCCSRSLTPRLIIAI